MLPLKVKNNSLIRKTASAMSVLTAVAMCSSVQAELRALDNQELEGVRGQAGLTIDIETKYTIGEFEYVDAGSLFIKDMRLGGIDNEYLDNLRATIDISDGNEFLARGFSDYAQYAEYGLLDASEADVAWAIDKYKDPTTGEIGEKIGDGDLLIHVSATDYGYDFTQPQDPADHASNLAMMKNAIDLKMFQGELGLRSSDGSVETVLTRNFSVEAYLGYLDILITNRGNGFSQTDEEGEPSDIRLSDSHIYIDAKFRVEDLDVDSTQNATNTYVSRNVTNPYLTLRDMRIHNERGADTLGSFGFASVEQKIAAATDILPDLSHMAALASSGNLNNIQEFGVDGISFYDINVRWDWDLPHIQFGDTDTSIGEVYFTDFVIHGTNLTISAH